MTSGDDWLLWLTLLGLLIEVILQLLNLFSSL